MPPSTAGGWPTEPMVFTTPSTAATMPKAGSAPARRAMAAAAACASWWVGLDPLSISDSISCVQVARDHHAQVVGDELDRVVVAAHGGYFGTAASRGPSTSFDGHQAFLARTNGLRLVSWCERRRHGTAAADVLIGSAGGGLSRRVMRESRESAPQQSAGPEDPRRRHWGRARRRQTENRSLSLTIGRTPPIFSGRSIRIARRHCSCRRGAGVSYRATDDVRNLVRMGDEVTAALRACRHGQHAVVDELDRGARRASPTAAAPGLGADLLLSRAGRP